jgi:hypothetical protein
MRAKQEKEARSSLFILHYDDAGAAVYLDHQDYKVA